LKSMFVSIRLLKHKEKIMRRALVMMPELGQT